VEASSNILTNVVFSFLISVDRSSKWA